MHLFVISELIFLKKRGEKFKIFNKTLDFLKIVLYNIKVVLDKLLSARVTSSYLFDIYNIYVPV